MTPISTLPTPHASAPARDQREIVVVCAADEAFALPLAVTVRSALANLDPTGRLRLYVLDGGLSDESKSRLLASWSFRRLEVEWIQPDLTLLAGLAISRHVNLVTYYRLLLPSLLPEQVERVIYLDADVLVRRDLSLLWDERQDDMACLAVQDTAAPYLDARAALPQFDRCYRYLAAVEPIPNYRELGLSPEAKYFNAGVLVIDLKQWRAMDVTGRVLECLRRHSQHVQWWDQYALNVVLAGRWRALDARWNQGVHAYTYPSWSESPFEAAAFQALRQEPWVVHFTSQDKPWHYYCRHPFREDYLAEVARTAWQGWSPQVPSKSAWSQWWRYRVAPLRRAVKVGSVRVKRIAAPLKRAA